MSDRLAASGWPALVRGALIILPAVFWAASLAAAVEALSARTMRLGPVALAATGALALAVAEWLVVFGW